MQTTRLLSLIDVLVVDLLLHRRSTAKGHGHRFPGSIGHANKERVVCTFLHEYLKEGSTPQSRP